MDPYYGSIFFFKIMEIWKLCIFYGNSMEIMHILWKLWKLYGNYGRLGREKKDTNYNTK